MGINERFRDAQLLGDGIQCRMLVAPQVEKLDGGGDDALALQSCHFVADCHMLSHCACPIPVSSKSYLTGKGLGWPVSQRLYNCALVAPIVGRLITIRHFAIL